ncbi:hypothetical protein BHM03_00036372 [Ensete ventricosum]|nr:hypothetical protein BHM03_00036372 [Ensete ventricosum]
MLFLVAVSTFLFWNSRFMGASWALHESRTILQFGSEGREVRVEAMSGEDNAGGDLGTRLITRVRFLLGMKIPKHRRAGHAGAAYSPAPAPANGAETPAPVPLFKTHVLPASPLHRRPHIAPVQILEYGSGSEARERHRRRILIVVVVACAGATLVVLGVAVTLTCKRSQRRTSKKRPERLMLLPSSGPKLQASAAAAPSNKVSFDPSSDHFGGRDSRPRAAPRIEDRSSLGRSEPSTLGFVHSIESHDLESTELCSKLEMAAVESSPSDELTSLPAPSTADLLSTAESAAKEPMTCPHQSKSVSPDGNRKPGFDEKMIESLFGYKFQSSSRTEEGKSKTPSPSKHVMEHKRLQNITILMKALNATSEQVRNALMLGEGLTVQQLEALVKMAPTKEEEEKLSSDDELDPAEKFLKAVLQVELRSSRLFFRLLEAVLKTGNRMNVGTIRGGARAFKLDALLKLADVKGTDGKTTLLHFVVQEIVRLEGVNAMETEIEKHKSKTNTAEEKEEDHGATGLKLVSGLSTELGNVKKTASMDLDVLISSVSNLSSGLSQSKQLVEQDMMTMVDEKSKRFAHRLRSFLNEAEKTVKELKEEENQVLLQVRNITEYYHGDVSKDEANPLRIFVIVRDFLCLLDRVCKEVGSNSKTQHQGSISLLLLDRRG